MSSIYSISVRGWCSGGTKAIAEACRRPGKSIEPLDYGETYVYKKTFFGATPLNIYLHNLLSELPFEMLPINQLFKSSLKTVFVILFVIYYYSYSMSLLIDRDTNWFNHNEINFYISFQRYNSNMIKLSLY